MRFTRRIAIVSLTLSILGFWQTTLAFPGNPVPRESEKTTAVWEENACPGGLSQTLTLGGEVKNPTTFDLQKLINLQQDLKKQDPVVVTEVTVSFQTGSGPRTETYYGVPLWEFINNEISSGGLQPGNSGQNSKNAFLRQYILAEATDCYGSVISIGEIHPNFEAKQVLIAYAKKASDGSIQYLTDTDEGFARLVVPGDKAGGRYISNLRNILVLSAPASPLKAKYFRQP
ncbi:hypothetical protein [Brasilonema sp. UFV-L1]|uniref:hypothetical protein n=1 Tax=Brasilonema sp. UFV-L1 TaxID=2234130 RepID=UPI00145EBB55|nr:hypothetical protein [Brasilonema sp. UFV-L1]NMG06821.1 hypothetical protein [Brasilonema sp. UFV-L1]